MVSVIICVRKPTLKLAQNSLTFWAILSNFERFFANFKVGVRKDNKKCLKLYKKKIKILVTIKTCKF